MTTDNIRFTLEFDLVNEVANFTDNLAALYNTTHRLTLSNVKGLIKVTGPSGIIYMNTGYTAGDFSSPDIDGSVPTWTVEDIPLTVDSDGLIEEGSYQVEYKLTTGAASYYVSKDIDLDITFPDIDIDVEHSCIESTLSATDDTDYTASYGGSALDPTLTAKTITIRPPLLSTLSTTTSNNDALVIGPRIWSGGYNISIETEAIYRLLSWSDNTSAIEVKIGLSSEIAHTVECSSCGCNFFACIEAIRKKYEAARNNNPQEAARLQRQLISVVTNYTLYLIGERCGSDTSTFCANIQAIVESENCLCGDGASGVPTEIVPISAVLGGSSTSVQIFNGVGAPSSALGNNGDYYFNDSTGGYYTKITNNWVLQYAGPPSGSDGADGADGADAVVVLDNQMENESTSAGTLEETLHQYVMEAGTMSRDGDILEVESLVELAQNTNDKRIKLYLGGTTIVNHNVTGSVTTDNNYLKIIVQISRKNASNQYVSWSVLRDGQPLAISEGELMQETTENLASAITLRVTGQNGAVSAADIISKQFIVKLLKKTA